MASSLKLSSTLSRQLGYVQLSRVVWGGSALAPKVGRRVPLRWSLSAVQCWSSFCGSPSSFSTLSSMTTTKHRDNDERDDDMITNHETVETTLPTSERLSKLISQQGSNMAMSRREAERLIRNGDVTVAGRVITSPHYRVSLDNSDAKAIKVSGKHWVSFASTPNATSSSESTTKVWLVHKVAGEVVSENDPQGRPSLLDRLVRGGVGSSQFFNNSNGSYKPKSQKDHIKAVGRLDMSTEGLIIVTNDGQYARELELPSNQLHRTYRVRVHGNLTPHKLKAMRMGLTANTTKNTASVQSLAANKRKRNSKTNTGESEIVDSTKKVRYGPMKVQVEEITRTKGTSSNNWLRITCTEGKNRQIRNVLSHLGLNVTRLIRVSYGDYELQTIPPGMALEVPVKELSKHRRRGALKRNATDAATKDRRRSTTPSSAEKAAAPIQWIRHAS